MEQSQVQINLDPSLYALSNVNIQADEEQFVLLLTSGIQARQFLVTPKHVKRILLLLQKVVGQYELKFGNIETELPQVVGQANTREFGFGEMGKT